MFSIRESSVVYKYWLQICTYIGLYHEEIALTIIVSKCRLRINI